MLKMAMAEENKETDPDFKAISETDHNKISDSLTKAGYADGKADGRDSVFQECFDRGYADGLKTGLRIGALRALAQQLEALQADLSPELQEELKKFKQTDLLKPESKEHFQMRQNSDLPMSEISQQQNNYVDELEEKAKTEFPLIYSFINNK